MLIVKVSQKTDHFELVKFYSEDGLEMAIHQ